MEAVRRVPARTGHHDRQSCEAVRGDAAIRHTSERAHLRSISSRAPRGESVQPPASALETIRCAAVWRFHNTTPGYCWREVAAAHVATRRRGRGTNPTMRTAHRAHFADSIGVALAVALVAVVASCRHEDERAARVAPERAGLVFTRYASADKPSVWLAEADGSHARRVVAGAYSANLSPDGRRLAYIVPADDPNSLPNLFVRDLAGVRTRRVGRAFGYEWSPDGTRLAAEGPHSLVLSTSAPVRGACSCACAS